jgi:uncharacterized UBP type Zn finger protein
MADGCTHLDQIHFKNSDATGCRECLETGGTWVHLRLCTVCGQVGCCDDSPNTHATKHFRAEGHPLIRSYEPDEDWWWCFVDQVAFELQGAGPARAGG